MAKVHSKGFASTVVAVIAGVIGQRLGGNWRTTSVTATFGVVKVVVFVDQEFAWGPPRLAIEAGHPGMPLPVGTLPKHKVTERVALVLG